MDAKKAAALREPFPEAAVGKLPKPYKADSPRSTCRECGGYHGPPAVHLDYVGHAATTDRLLQVDPEWMWEPFAVDADGLPALDRKGNLWIRLTVLGVTRIGVGDGKSAKECIGDAIRNAAMRFGVALDLWAKEDLQSAKIESGHDRDPEPAPRQQEPQQSDPWQGDPPTYRSEAQSKKLAILLRELGMTNRDEALAYIGGLVGHAVESTKVLTVAEASKVIDALSTMQAQSVNPQTGEVPR